MRNKILIIIGAISILLNGYFLIWKRIEQKIYIRGANDTIASIITQAQQGDIRITTQNGIIVLRKVE